MTEGESIRPELGKTVGHSSVPLDDKDVVLFFSGIKDLPIVNDVLARLVVAGSGIASRDHFVLGFKAHPGEQPKRPGERATQEEQDAFSARTTGYNTLMKERKQMLDGVTTLVFGDASLPELVRASDVTVFTGGATESITAAYARLVTAYYSDDAVVAHHNRQVGRTGGSWFVADLGGTWRVGPEDFEENIRFLLTPEGRNALRRRQEENFPVPDDWDTASKIVRFLEEEVQAAA